MKRGMEIMAEYIKLSELEKAVLTKQEEEKRYWFDWLKRFSTTKDYSVKEQAVDNFLRGYGEAVQYMLSVNEQLRLKSADVVEVVHGEWVYKKEKDGYFCSVCDIEALIDPNFIGRDFAMEELSDYCPHCGAKMDGERRSDDG
jgi:rubrerythrin